MITIKDARDRIGADVVYQPHPTARREDGVITSVNPPWVFVRYTGDQQSKATPPSALSWLSEGVPDG